MAGKIIGMIVMTLMAVSLVACGGKEKPKALSPLTSEQLDQVESLTRSMDQVEEAIGRAKTTGNFAEFNTPLPKAKVGSARKMAEKISKTFCRYRENPNNPGGVNRESFLIVDGADCPVRYETRSREVESNTEFSTALSMDYEVVGLDFKEMNDIEAFKVEGTIGARGTIRGAEFFGRVQGTAWSQSFGTIHIIVDNGGLVSRDGGSQILSLTLRYLDVVATGRVETQYNSNGDKVGHSYFINDVPFAEKDFRDIMGSTLLDK